MSNPARTSSIEDVRAAIAAGFTTKQAQKDAGRGLEIELSALNDAAKAQGASIWDLPNHPFQISKKALATFDGLGLGEKAREIKAALLELRDAPVVKVVKIDDTKVRDMPAAEAEAYGLVYTGTDGRSYGYCYCCGRVGFKVDTKGELSFHGFSRPGIGYTIGSCEGSHQTPSATLDIALAYCRRMVAQYAALLAGDMVEVTVRRLGQMRADRYSDGSDCDARIAFVEGKGPQFRSYSNDVADTRTTIEREQAANADHLAQLEIVEAKRDEKGA